jgi:sugar phosphate isomerase/epimerase
MPQLLVLQSVWGLDQCPGFAIEAKLEEALAAVVAAGFDGVGTNLARTARTAGVARAMNPLGLAWEGQVLVRSADELRHWIGEAERLGAHHLNVQIAGPLAHLPDALALVDSLTDAARDAPLPVRFETHRGRLTNDLLFTLRLLEARPDLPLTADLSHYPVAGEMELPLRADQLAAIESILRHAHNFHGRVSSTHQVQVALDAPQHRGWRDQHIAWWRRGFELWLERAAPDDALTFMCELGPPPYAITAPDGRELTNRWDEAQRMRDIVRGLWAEVGGAS